MADLVAHSLYKCVDKPKSCFCLTEPRYLLEFRDRFFRDKISKKVIGKGIKPVHSLKDLNLDDDIKFFLNSLDDIKI